MNTIFVTEQDYERLHQLVQTQRSQGNVGLVDNLCRGLRQASIIPAEQVPIDVVTMNSLVRLREKKSGTRLELSVVYPKDANLASGKISVLAPVGAAILGHKVAEEITCEVAGRTLNYEVEEVIYQPEAAGDFAL
ncbi:nucleoside diphosphate kinase regulator [Rufibacter sp. LB8]|uniref:nucleoside diphosphate kinase regulator n=1 Tax=Rufibacter sp. LB8 TaxID=2777781 RepID=UPI00178C3691|nr:nucleoside diphosphate kinase regulator [Rufibacter sp. LB8]